MPDTHNHIDETKAPPSSAHIHVAIQAAPLAELAPEAWEANHDCGASLTFTGRVRRKNAGREVVRLAYDVHTHLAEQVITKIAEEACAQWCATTGISVVHARGSLGPGDVSVVVQVQTPHRAEAFAICRYIIDELKHRAPIWKKEWYSDGETEWLEGHALCQRAHHH